MWFRFSKVYEDLLEDFPEDQREELLKAFRKQHNDFRDSVSAPKTISILAVILFGGLIFSLSPDAEQQFLLSLVAGAIGWLTEITMENFFVEKNLRKMERFLESQTPSSMSST